MQGQGGQAAYVGTSPSGLWIATRESVTEQPTEAVCKQSNFVFLDSCDCFTKTRKDSQESYACLTAGRLSGREHVEHLTKLGGGGHFGSAKRAHQEDP